MHTDKRLLLQSILLEPKFGRRQEKREIEQIVKCLLSDLEHCTFCSVLDNRILARLPWRSSADEPPDLPQMPFPSSNSHTSPINTLRLHQILDSSLYLSVSATRET
jgi:hypothetical protein